MRARATWDTEMGASHFLSADGWLVSRLRLNGPLPPFLLTVRSSHSMEVT